MTKELLLEVKNAHVHYGGVRALDGAGMNIDEGEVVSLMGPNGAGKSTLLKAIFGLAPMIRGEIFYHGRKIKPKPHKMVSAGVAFVPQGRRVFTSLTVLENLEMGGFVIKDKTDLARRIEETLEIFPDLKRILRKKSGALSGGQQQMVALARGLIIEPKLLLLDEPSLGLAPKIVGEVFSKIKEINERRKTAIVIVEHNLKTLLKITDRAYVLDKGRVVASDKPEVIIEKKILEKVFLGQR